MNENDRIEEMRLGKAPWRKWGPYLSERQWGTVREDYSENGDAWEYTTHEQARSRAYRWGEDGLGGISDEKQLLCLGFAFWNGKDPILKERLFGLGGFEGNHGEDVKEVYFYLDNTPTHSYMKYLYKYPQETFPYEPLLKENQKRTRLDPEYELIDTGIFDQDRYYDIVIEYAKRTPEDICIKLQIHNRGDKEETLHILPTIWFRNHWSFHEHENKPQITQKSSAVLQAKHPDLGTYFLYGNPPEELLFTENDTNQQKLFGLKNKSPYVKDGFHEYVVNQNKEAVNPAHMGTKGAFHYIKTIPPQSSITIHLRLSTDDMPQTTQNLFSQRQKEADAFYEKVTPFALSEDLRTIQRQAFSALLWNKQFYHYNVKKWLHGDPDEPPPPPQRHKGRNQDWEHFDASDVLSMPDAWEFPWFASWDLAFHTIPLAMIDPDFAKNQLLLLCKEWYMHPNGQIPAYEWNFCDVNPPVHAWAALRVYQIEGMHHQRKDIEFLEKIFHKLLLNFTWWVNRKDLGGKNIFEGGFLGLDNIGPFDRNAKPPFGDYLEQPDATGWMGMYCLNLFQIALELSAHDRSYEEMATKFFEHFLMVADAINGIATESEGLWDEERGFFYGQMVHPNGARKATYYDSMTGIIPLFALSSGSAIQKEHVPEFHRHFNWILKNQPDKLQGIVTMNQEKVLLSLVSPEKLKRMLNKILAEDQFLSSFGIRSLSKDLEKNPYVLDVDDDEWVLNYEPAESTTPLFGGNSNWRGPIWFPLNYLLIESLQKFHYFLGDDFLIEYPTGSGNMKNLWDIGCDLSRRLIKIFQKDEHGKRPVYGNQKKFQEDLHFHEYFHGDTGKGLGACNHAGWTALIAKLIHQTAKYEAK